eukprot:197876_1
MTLYKPTKLKHLVSDAHNEQISHKSKIQFILQQLHEPPDNNNVSAQLGLELLQTDRNQDIINKQLINRSIQKVRQVCDDIELMPQNGNSIINSYLQHNGQESHCNAISERYILLQYMANSLQFSETKVNDYWDSRQHLTKAHLIALHQLQQINIVVFEYHSANNQLWQTYYYEPSFNKSHCLFLVYHKHINHYDLCDMKNSKHYQLPTSAGRHPINLALKEQSNVSTTLNPNAQTFKPTKTNTLSTNNLPMIMEEKIKSVDNQYNPINRAKGRIQISRKLRHDIFPEIVEETLSETERDCYMDKSVALNCGEYGTKEYIFESGKITIVHCDVRNKIKKHYLYGIVVKQDTEEKRSCYDLKMLNHLFTAEEIEEKYHISEDRLPKSPRSNPTIKLQLKQKQNILSLIQNNATMLDILKNTKWNEIDVLNDNHNSTKLTMTLKLNSEEFVHKLIQYFRSTAIIDAIPIMLFHGTKYSIEYMVIVETNEMNNFGLTFKFIDNIKSMKITAVHLNKQSIFTHHKLAVPDHICSCSSVINFKCNASHLEIYPAETMELCENYVKQFVAQNNDLQSASWKYWIIVGKILLGSCTSMNISFLKHCKVPAGVYNILSDPKERNGVIRKTKWHKIAIYSSDTSDSFILSMSKQYFCEKLLSQQKKIKIIPIRMMSEIEIKYLWIVQIYTNVKIGIIFKYDQKSSVKATSIHLNNGDFGNSSISINLRLFPGQNVCSCRTFVMKIANLNLCDPMYIKYQQWIHQAQELYRNVN